MQLYWSYIKKILIKSSDNDTRVKGREEPANVSEVDETEVMWA